MQWYWATTSFTGQGLNARLKDAVDNAESGKGATVFGYYVDDPERFGIVEFNQDGKAISIEEKPEHPKSQLLRDRSVLLRQQSRRVRQRIKTMLHAASLRSPT